MCALQVRLQSAVRAQLAPWWLAAYATAWACSGGTPGLSSAAALVSRLGGGCTLGALLLLVLPCAALYHLEQRERILFLHSGAD